MLNEELTRETAKKMVDKACLETTEGAYIVDINDYVDQAEMFSDEYNDFCYEVSVLVTKDERVAQLDIDPFNVNEFDMALCLDCCPNYEVTAEEEGLIDDNEMDGARCVLCDGYFIHGIKEQEL